MTHAQERFSYPRHRSAPNILPTCLLLLVVVCPLIWLLPTPFAQQSGTAASQSPAGSETSAVVESDLLDDPVRTVTVVVDLGVVRADPTYTAPVLFRIAKGRVYRLLETLGSWRLIEIPDGRQGWAHQSLFESTSDAADHGLAQPAPSEDSGSGSSPAPVESAAAAPRPMVLISSEQLLAKAASDPPAIPNELPQEPLRTVTVGVDIGLVREAPDFNAPITYKIAKGLSYTVLESDGAWLYIEEDDGRRGWAHSSLFASEPPASASPLEVDAATDTASETTVATAEPAAPIASEAEPTPEPTTVEVADASDPASETTVAAAEPAAPVAPEAEPTPEATPVKVADASDAASETTVAAAEPAAPVAPEAEPAPEPTPVEVAEASDAASETTVETVEPAAPVAPEAEPTPEPTPVEVAEASDAASETTVATAEPAAPIAPEAEPTPEPTPVEVADASDAARETTVAAAEPAAPVAPEAEPTPEPTPVEVAEASDAASETTAETVEPAAPVAPEAEPTPEPTPVEVAEASDPASETTVETVEPAAPVAPEAEPTPEPTPVEVAEASDAAIETTVEAAEPAAPAANEPEPAPTPAPEADTSPPDTVAAAVENGIKRDLITLNFNRTDLRELLSALALKMGTNIIMRQDVTGTISIHLNQVSLEQAIDAIVFAGGFKYYKHKDLYYVYKPKDEEKLMSRPDVELRIFELKFGDIAKIQEILDELPDKYLVKIHEPSRTVIVEDTPENIARIEKLINYWDAMPRQVMIEAKILEVSLTSGMSLGGNWAKLLGDTLDSDIVLGTSGFSQAVVPTEPLQSPLSDTAQTGVFGSLITGVGTAEQFSMALDALQNRTNVETLSTPKILAVHGKGARVQVGGQQGYKVLTVQDGVAIEGVRFIDTGTILDITPYIDEKRNVLLKVMPSIRSAELQDGIPVVKSTNVSTWLRAKDGQTVFIGGLITDQKSRIRSMIPCLGGIPVGGMLFGRTTGGIGKTELVVLITPKVLTAQPQPELAPANEMVEQHETDMERYPLPPVIDFYDFVLPGKDFFEERRSSGQSTP